MDKTRVKTTDGREIEAKPLNCKGCAACCRNDIVPLTQYDDPTQYKTNLIDGTRVLKRKNGDCIYLGRKGCRIYDRRPWMCRNFDCRRYLVITDKEREERLAADSQKWTRIFEAAERHRAGE